VLAHCWAVRRRKRLSCQCLPPAPIGAIGRNIFTGDRLYAFDLAMLKSVHLHNEGRSIDFGSRDFNILNRADFGAPVRILESPGFGRSVSTVNSPRMLQVSQTSLPTTGYGRDLVNETDGRGDRNQKALAADEPHAAAHRQKNHQSVIQRTRRMTGGSPEVVR
jgi:hypothetical protein